MNSRDTPDRLERYLDRFRALTGAEPVVSQIAAPEVGRGRVLAAVYSDYPDNGLITGFTYGLSLVDHPEWVAGRRRELTITVRSADVEWAAVPARAVESMRGLSAFHRGRVLGYARRFVEGSSMSSLLLADPVIEWDSAAFDLALGQGDPGETDLVDFVGVVPLHASEREFVKENGLEALLALQWDRCDPARPPVV